MRLYFIRHGERGHGKNQDKLTEEGRKQCKNIAQFFQDKNIDKIICGTKNRTKNSAKPILEKINCEIRYTPEVNERELGDLEGKSGTIWRKAVEESDLSEDEFRPKSGENRIDAYERAKSFFNKLKKEKGNILVVSHSGFISDMITFLLGLSNEDSSNFKTSHCSVSFFEIDDNFNVKKCYIGKKFNIK